MTLCDPLPEIEFKYQKNKIGFELLSIESLWQKKFIDHKPSDPHRVTFFTLIYFAQGQGVHYIDFKPHQFAPGTLISIYPNQVHSWDFSSQPQGQILVLSPLFVEQLSANIKAHFNSRLAAINALNSPVIALKSESEKQILSLLDNIDYIQKQTTPNSLAAMHIYLALHLLLEDLRPDLLDNKLSLKQNKVFSNFIELLSENCHRMRDATWYANQLNTTYKTLNVLCKLGINRTAKQLINEFAIVEMKRSLAVDENSIQTLSLNFGFEDTSNFNKFFKKLVGLTPRQFQKKIGH